MCTIKAYNTVYDIRNVYSTVYDLVSYGILERDTLQDFMA